MVTKEKNTGLYPLKYKNSKKLLSWGEIEDIVSKMPKEFGAKIDHRIKRDTWIWVKSEFQTDARDFLKNELGVLCVEIETSEKWYFYDYKN